MEKSIKVIAILVLTMAAFIGCTKPDEPNNSGNNVTPTDEHQYVDLGLPSGTLWASCNVGANSPEERGSYFAWGETETKEMYDWKQYKYCTVENNVYVLTKYCADSSYGFNGFVDTLRVLEPMDDAARANWGDNWRMPTKEEWEELLRETTDTLTEQNGVEGRLFTGSNGNSLFLPNTGFFLDDEVICPNLGIYWSSTLQTTFQIVAWSYHSDIDECHVCGTYERSRGQCVRAVRAK